jgi:hypothetical protein
MLDELDDFVFEPTEWDLATTVAPRVDPESDREALDELADAMLVRLQDGPELDRLTDDAAQRLWLPELDRLVRAALQELTQKEDEWRDAAVAALRDLDARRERAEVAREVVRHLAMQLGNDDVPFLFCFDCLDEAVERAPSANRRALALQAACAAVRNAGIGAEEAKQSVAVPIIARDLGTIERRVAVRRRLARLARFGRESIPSLAAELARIAEEAPPTDPQEDDVWEVVVAHALADVAEPELN